MTHRNFLLTTLIVIIVLTLSFCKKEESTKQTILNDLHNLSEIQDFTGFTVSIFWLDKEVLTRYPWSVKDLINRAKNSIILRDSQIVGKLNEFSQIIADDLEIVDKQYRVEARFYVVIESIENGKLFELILFGGDHFYIVNGITIKPSERLLEAVKPLLNDEGKTELELYKFWKSSNF